MRGCSRRLPSRSGGRGGGEDGRKDPRPLRRNARGHPEQVRRQGSQGGGGADRRRGRDRKLTLAGERGEIVDLAEEKIYELDVKKKTYTVTTFAALKKRIEEQRAKAEKEAAEARKKEEKKEEDASAAPVTEMEIDVEVNEAGQKRRSPATRRVR